MFDHLMKKFSAVVYRSTSTHTHTEIQQDGVQQDLYIYTIYRYLSSKYKNGGLEIVEDDDDDDDGAHSLRSFRKINS